MATYTIAIDQTSNVPYTVERNGVTVEHCMTQAHASAALDRAKARYAALDAAEGHEPIRADIVNVVRIALEELRYTPSPYGWAPVPAFSDPVYLAPL